MKNKKTKHKKQKDMMKMRKLFFKLSMLLFVLAMSVNAAWAGVSIGEPSDWYYVNFETRVSTPACGSNPGQVKLNYTDNQGNQDNPWIVGPKTANPYNEETQSTEYGHWNDGFNEGSNARENGADRDGYPDYYCIDNDRSKGFMDKRGEGWYAGWDWYNAGHYLNTLTGETEDEYQTAWGTSANLNGYAMIHMADMDLDLMSAYAYFEAKVRENDGWYFAGWSYKEGDTDLGGAVDTDTPEDKGKLFKIFPSDLQGWSNKSKVYAYATFKPVMVANYKVNGLINKSVSSTTTVVFDVVGERVSAEDFTVSCPEDNFSAAITSCADNKVTVTVTYSGSADGEFRGNVTLASKSGCSQLTAAVYARVGATSEAEASLYNNKVLVENLVESDDLNTLIGKATATQIVALNDNYEALTVNRDVTIFTNGYRVSTLNVTNGTVTMVYDKYEGGADAVSVTGGKLILNGGKFGTLTIGANGEVEQNGANFTGAATNNGTLTTNEGVFNAGLTSSKTLTVNNGTFKGTTALTISGGTANINRGTIEGTTNGLKVTGGTVTIKKLAAIKGGTNSVLAAGGTVNVECGKFDGLLSAVASFTSGYFKTKADAANVEEGKEWMQLTDGVEYNEGYRFFLGDSETAKTNGVGVCRIGDVSYAKLEDALAYANNKPNEEVVIFMTNNYTLPAGYYTLPAKATLVVPMSDSQQKINLTAPRLVSNDVQNADEDKYINNIPYEFRRLTFATGVNMDVIGKIEMTCTQYSSNEAYTSQPVGAYGHLVLEEGSHLTLQSGSEVRAWGFVTGKGEMDARRGSVVREMFQMGDWKGAMTSVLITGMVAGTGLEGAVKGAIGGADSGDFSDKKIFPVSQYFIQNIESPVKYHPGALLSTSAAVSEGVYGMSLSMSAPDIAVVGVSGEHTAIFLMDIAADAENTWVRKWYDAENDIQVYEINSGAHIGSMELDMGELSLMGMSVPVRLNSGLFDLPITSNFKIHLLSGTMDFEQNTCLLPGSEVEVDKESTVTVAMSADDKAAKEAGTPDHVYHSGAVYVYDQTDWDRYAYNNKFTKVVRYAPSALNGVGGQPNLRNEDTNPASAKINVHGTFNTADGYVYTSAGGANIYSSNEDAGTFIFSNAASEAGDREVWQIKGKGTSNGDYKPKTFTVAKLKNGDNSYTETAATGANQVYMYKNDEWHTAPALFYFDCFTAEVDMEKYAEEAGKKASEQPYDLGSAVQHIYIKPQEWVEVVGKPTIQFDWSTPPDLSNDSKNPYLVGVEGNDDHTFSDAAGTGRLFILMDDGCQWWEVENVNNLYHCVHPNNDTYYYWGVDPADDEEKWLEKKFTITWKNWNGDTIQTKDKDNNLVDEYEVSYGTMAEFLGTNPTRENNIDSTYNFTGWKPALGPVTQDVTYTATFESQPRMYTIIFQNEGGTEIERQFLTHNAVPVCENTPTKIGHTLVWSPAISPVIGDQTYTATWLENPPTEWDVTFVNNAGDTLQETEAIGVSEHPVYSGSTPAKENADHTAYSSNEYTYTFWGWSAVIDGVAQPFEAGAELPCPTAPTTYTAVYTETATPYEVKFITYNGNATNPDHEIASGSYTYGATPIAPTVEQVLAAIADVNTPNYTFNNDKYTYSFAWNPQIQTVMGTQNYTATIDSVINQYTVTLKSNLSGVCTFTGAGTFDYGTTINNVAVSYNSEKYTFNGWSDSETAAAHSSFTLAGDITLTANFTPIAIEDHTVTKDATWNVPVDTEVKDLILTSDGSACGQLLNPENLTIRGEAIFRMAQSFAAGQWYAVAVPWRVNPATGIYGASGRLASGSQIYIIEFDGAAYANVGGTDDTNQYWHFLHETGADMVPGKLYMIYLRSAQSKLDFHKKAGAALQTRNLTVSTASGSAGASFANWNAISNPALYTADLSTGVIAYQTYDNNGDQTYTVVDAATSGIIVAKPIFVQVNTPSTVYATVSSSPDPAPAYRRAPQAANDAKFVVEISSNGKMADRLIVETADEKENLYVIGQDLSKFGVSKKVAQMWINRYDSKLCKNTVEFEGERAEYPLSIYAPVAGEYVLTAAQQRGEEALYLTRNGEAIWNLSEGDYVLSMEKGTSTQYGLRISAKAPQNATGVDEAVVDAQGDTKKVLINDKVYIIRGDRVYTVDGQLVK
jgi:uncharacterized repeat protein (TIGR02543 family)